jgi:hypothetical protein
MLLKMLFSSIMQQLRAIWQMKPFSVRILYTGTEIHIQLSEAQKCHGISCYTWDQKNLFFTLR